MEFKLSTFGVFGTLSRKEKVIITSGSAAGLVYLWSMVERDSYSQLQIVGISSLVIHLVHLFFGVFSTLGACCLSF